MKEKIKKLVAAVKKVGTLNLVLILVGAFFVWFNWQMILVFREYGSMPETYACAVVAATIGECGICGWIRTNKDKRLDRKWQKEDEKESQEQYVPDINVGTKTRRKTYELRDFFTVTVDCIYFYRTLHRGNQEITG